MAATVLAKGNPRGSGYERNANDWYVEPREAVLALLDAETFDGLIYDPACGQGTIPKACIDRGKLAIGSDIVDRGYGHVRDFLRDEPFATDVANIICNPPFNLAEEFIDRAREEANDKIAILQRLSFLEGWKRLRLWRAMPIARVHVFPWRISMPPGGASIEAKGGSVAFAWFVWERGYQGAPTLNWLQRAQSA